MDAMREKSNICNGNAWPAKLNVFTIWTFVENVFKSLGKNNEISSVYIHNDIFLRKLLWKYRLLIRKRKVIFLKYNFYSVG